MKKKLRILVCIGAIAVVALGSNPINKPVIEPDTITLPYRALG